MKTCRDNFCTPSFSSINYRRGRGKREHVQCTGCVTYNSWRILEGLILNTETNRKKDFDRKRRDTIYRVTANSIRIHSLSKYIYTHRKLIPLIPFESDDEDEV